MNIQVGIEVKGSKVIISVGGQPSADSGDGMVVSQGSVRKGDGEGGGHDDPGSGGGGGAGSGTVVIGPIVVDCSVQSSGGDDGGQGGGHDDPGSGGGGPVGSGVLVIGPIVICGRRQGGGTTTSKEINE